MGVRALQLQVRVVSDWNVCMDGMPSKLCEKRIWCDQNWVIVRDNDPKAHELVEGKICIHMLLNIKENVK